MKFEKGPVEVIRALLSGNPEQVAEALEFQRQSFHARFGCYPEEMTWNCLVPDEQRSTDEQTR